MDSIATAFRGRRLLLPLILSLVVAAVATGYVLAGGWVPAISSRPSAAAPAPAVPVANPHEGLPVEVPLNKDVGLTLYRNLATRTKVVTFYDDLVGSSEIAGIVMKVANRFDVPLSLAFALAWKESDFRPNAVNYNGDSVDRGLYQLNSLSFPGVTSQQFFDPRINAEKGLGYLSECLKVGGNEVVGLAMYNAGMSRVSTDGTPRVTLDYISTILKYQDAVITEFQHAVLKQADVLKVLRTTETVS